MLLSLILAQVLTATQPTGQLQPISATSCSAGQFVNAISTSGSGTCGVPSGGGSSPTYVVLTANRTNATTSYADITDLIIPVGANERLDIECRMNYAANATTTGIGIGWTGPASPTLTFGQMTAPLTTATVGGTNSTGNDTGGVTTASVLAAAGNTAIFKGSWLNGANSGNVQMRFKSEVAIANAIIIQAGSWCKYQAF